MCIESLLEMKSALLLTRELFARKMGCIGEVFKMKSVFENYLHDKWEVLEHFKIKWDMVQLHNELCIRMHSKT